MQNITTKHLEFDFLRLFVETIFEPGASVFGRYANSVSTRRGIYCMPPIRKVVIGTIHLRRQHVLGGEGCPHVPMVKRSQYIRIKNPLHKHFAGMPMVGG